jgi:hypothetical protein
VSRPITRMSGLFAALVLFTAATAPSAASAHDDATSPAAPTRTSAELDRPVGAQLARVRAATARFHDVAVAEAAGYRQVSPCIDRPDGAAMGAHWVRLDLIDGRLDPAAPEALLYVPTRDGGQRLVGVEYLGTDAHASLFGQHLHAGPFGPSLHVWVWQANPEGMFADFNPRLTC